MKYLTIGKTYRIKPVLNESREYHNKVGTLKCIDEHASDGDAFGMSFDDMPGHIAYFWRRELEEVITDHPASV